MSTAFQLMKLEGRNLLEHLDPADAVNTRTRPRSPLVMCAVAPPHRLGPTPPPPVLPWQSYVRSLVVSIVLATDLALSFDIIGKFKVTFQNSAELPSGDKEIKEAKEMLLKMVRGSPLCPRTRSPSVVGCRCALSSRAGRLWDHACGICRRQ